LSEVNFTNLKADLENVCTAFFSLMKQERISITDYNQINEQIWNMEKKVEEIEEGSQPRGEE
jgi:hypothetical protein